MIQITKAQSKKFRCCLQGGIGDSKGLIGYVNSAWSTLPTTDPQIETARSFCIGKINEIPVAILDKQFRGELFDPAIETGFDSMFGVSRDTLIAFENSDIANPKKAFIDVCNTVANQLDSFQTAYLS